jgi:hypothetical protein
VTGYLPAVECPGNLPVAASHEHCAGGHSRFETTGAGMRIFVTAKPRGCRAWPDQAARCGVVTLTRLHLMWAWLHLTWALHGAPAHRYCIVVTVHGTYTHALLGAFATQWHCWNTWQMLAGNSTLHVPHDQWSVLVATIQPSTALELHTWRLHCRASKLVLFDHSANTAVRQAPCVGH